MNETDATLALVSSIVGVIPDPRRGNHVRHAARDLLFAAIIAMLCGCDSYEGFSRFAEHKLGWLRSKGFAFANGVPPHDAFYWLFRKLDPSLLSACLRSLAAGLRGKAGAGDFEVVAIDGKAARRGVGRGGKTPYIVNAWSSAGGYVLGGVKVEEKSNEITAVPKLLDLLRLEGCVVTLDAMGCQRDIAKRIVGRKADCVSVKCANVQVCKWESSSSECRRRPRPMELALAIETFTLSHLHTCTLRGAGRPSASTGSRTR